ncbi:MAG: acetyl-CoA carboxylase biotin carboxyl carrier protein [Oscillospiraceae bacterium]|nr:acetyl-CoA carboxylase biotin carboxyl carrier protein [Oscillospiraceae bacterium]
MSKKVFDMVDLETIDALAEMVKEKHLDEITIADGEQVITIKGKKCPPPPPAGGMPMPPRFHEGGMMPPIENAPMQSPAQAANSQSEFSGNIVKSPIVGTFYSSPSPEKPPFVTEGARVKKGDVLMIIESMKLMNEVQSEFDGTVEKILVQNGEAVEFDQPIMIIK